MSGRLNYSENPHYVQLREMLADDGISEIMINGCDNSFIERSGKLLPSPLQFQNKEEVEKLCEILLDWAGKTEAAKETPIVDGMLPGGNRINIVLPPLTMSGPNIAIRKFPKNALSLDRMAEMGVLTAHISHFLRSAARLRSNIVIAGSTSSGKTTLLNALSQHINSDERVVTIEDTPELQIQQDNVVRMMTHGAHGNAGTPITQRDLLKTSLRMRPDRIIMGEIRGIEAFDLLQAINTGHDGSMATIHANTPRDALTRIEMLVSMSNGNIPIKFLRQQLVSALDLVIQLKRGEDGQRRITHITEIIGLEGETVVSQDLFNWKQEGANPGQYVWASVSSRKPKIQKAIVESNASKGK